jgi:adenosylcobyric acid synthase
MSLMVLGTSSHAGKSVIAAGICRILSDRGISVAPFKSQNMSLNSYVTEEGHEIGIAQAVQAFAARARPVADMNPVLLKPKGPSVSQIVLQGKPWKDTEISAYYADTDFLLGRAEESYRRLEKEYHTIIVEGAGGAAEVNLYDRDIANILLAEKLRVPIILVADIERGGVFAQIYGTFLLLPEEVRKLVKGIVINKFRGDPALFASGSGILEKLTGIPVLGIVPWTELAIPDEDSLSLPLKKAQESPVRIAVIRYPHIANFTDFSLLERAASLHYVAPGTPLDGFDAVILPGTKNTVHDLQVLKSTGTPEELRKCIRKHIPVIGICGGYQMMGESIHDNAIEGDTVAVYEGLGFLPVRTYFETCNKTTRQVRRRSAGVPPILSRIDTVFGYEIHSGQSEVSGQPVFTEEGCTAPGGLVFGTYLHGLFADAGAVDALVSYLSGKKGVPYTHLTASGDPYAALARHLAAHLDTDAIIKLASPEFNDLPRHIHY